VEDLQGRDFTLNAMAVDLRKVEELIDPLGGVLDLFAKRLQACSATSLEDDPVRVLRAVRMSTCYGLSFTPEIRQQIAPASGMFSKVSIERLRDEFFKVMDAPKPAASLRVLDRFGVIAYLLPEMMDLKGVIQSEPHIYDVWEHSLHTVQAMENVLTVLDAGYFHDNELGGDIFTGLLSHCLGRYRQKITDHLHNNLTMERSHRALLYIAAFCHDITKPRHRYLEDAGRIRFTGHESSGAVLMRERAETLKLSRAEARWLSQIVEHHGRIIQFSWYDQSLTRRAVFRFWRDTREIGVDVCLLAIADVLSIFGHTLTQEFYQKHLGIIRTFLESYWEKVERVSPPLLLDGNDLMNHFSLSPGPQIGRLLEALQEAQAVGEVCTVEEARRYISDNLTDL
jgi:tRNA nucleotidyltransferase/poly(A) polymerase